MLSSWGNFKKQGSMKSKTKKLKSNNLFTKFDWWMFSKLNQTLDEVSNPYYYNPKENNISNFRSDFIFWMQKATSTWFCSLIQKGQNTRTDTERLMNIQEYLKRMNKRKSEIFRTRILPSTQNYCSNQRGV